jgi:[protein-PII] uridylyltransferase
VPSVRSHVQRLAAEPEFAELLRGSSEAAQLFIGLVATAKSTNFHHDSILGELHDVGLLVAMIPEFSPVVGRVHHDVYHVYTVDVHSIAAVDRLRSLVRGDLAQEQPLACRLAAEMTRPEMLFWRPCCTTWARRSEGATTRAAGRRWRRRSSRASACRRRTSTRRAT